VTVDEVDALRQALLVQVAVGDQIAVADLQLASPCPGWTVHQVMTHSIGVTRKFSEFAAGRTDTPRTPHGDLLGADHRAALRTAATAARQAWARVDLRRPCRLPFGRCTARQAAGINLFDVLAHTWDMASAVGLTVVCPDELWHAALAAATDTLGPNRDQRHYGPAVPPPPGGPAMVCFLHYLGRDVGRRG
jgi:uncharacterized protein (TIGR03086 family)